MYKNIHIKYRIVVPYSRTVLMLHSDLRQHFFQLAVDYKSNFMLETPTWRASRDWGAKVGLKQWFP